MGLLETLPRAILEGMDSAIENIDHAHTKARHSQTNGICTAPNICWCSRQLKVTGIMLEYLLAKSHLLPKCFDDLQHHLPRSVR